MLKIFQLCSILKFSEGKSISRGCAKLSATDYCDSQKTNNTKDAKCYFCDSDLCNASNRVAITFTATIVAAIFVLWF